MINNTHRLLPCPFCNGAAGFFDDPDYYGILGAFCNECGEPTESYSEKSNEAAKWNTRATLKSAEGVMPTEGDEQHAFESWLVRTRPSGDCEAMQRQWEESADFKDLYTAPQPQVEPVGADERAAFEKWMSSDGQWLRAIERDEAGHYKLMKAASDWEVWQARAALATTQPAEVQPWDGKLSDQLQRAINDLHTECKPAVVRHLDFAIRSEITALHTSLATVKRMYHAAQKRLDSIDAAQPDPFAVNSQAQPAPAGEYAALPELGIDTASHAGPRVRGYTADQMRDYADATHAMRADELNQRIKELEAKTSCCMGVGSGDGNLFVYGNYESIKAAQSIVLRAEQAMRAGEQEPVAWIHTNRLGGVQAFTTEPPPNLKTQCKPLYTSPVATQGEQAKRDAAFEAVRKKLCKLQRYSFFLNDKGSIVRVPQFTGNWIDFQAAHELFDPAAVDAAIDATLSATTPPTQTKESP